MQITNATAAAKRPFMRIERRLRVGRCLNQSRAARILPTKLSLRSERPGMVPPKSPALCCSRPARSFVGIPRTRPEAASRYALRIADPPVMIMAVRAAPSSVPATPKREVTKDAPVAASPADMIWGVVITELPLFALMAVESIRAPARFQRVPGDYSIEILRAACGGGRRPAVRMPGRQTREGWRHGGARQREVLRALRGDKVLLQGWLLPPRQGAPDHRRNLRFYVRAGRDARRPPRCRRHPGAVRLRLYHPGTRQPRPFERRRRGAGRALQGRVHGMGYQPPGTHPRKPPSPFPRRRELRRLRRGLRDRDPRPRKHRRRRSPRRDRRRRQRRVAQQQAAYGGLSALRPGAEGGWYHLCYDPRRSERACYIRPTVR